MSNLPEVRIQGKEGKWYECTPFAATVKGGKAVIYVTADGTEIKREPLARYTAREERNATDTSRRVKELVEAIVYDIRDRRGLKCEWDKIEADVQEEIKESWCNIVQSKLTE